MNPAIDVRQPCCVDWKDQHTTLVLYCKVMNMDDYLLPVLDLTVSWRFDVCCCFADSSQRYSQENCPVYLRV